MTKRKNAFTLIEILVVVAIGCILFGMIFSVSGCDVLTASTPTSSTGVKKATANVPVQSNGLTIEQNNVKERLARDNKVGSVKHLYIISSLSGDVLLYSTVKGKVTSSGKRLTPNTVLAANGGEWAKKQGIIVNIGGTRYRTSEVLQDDGTYGSSIPYLFWFDQRGRYHQHYVSGGHIVHVSDYPVRVGKIIINLEDAGGK